MACLTLPTCVFIWTVCLFSVTQQAIVHGFDVTHTIPGPNQLSINILFPNVAPTSCKDVVSNSSRVVVTLADGLEVMCDTQTDGGGWTIIQRRTSGALDFYRGWQAYKFGFGDVAEDFWLGNEYIHRLTNQRRHQLRVDITSKGKDFYAQYSRFRLYGESDKYRLMVSGYSGTAGDSLTRLQNNMMFSTKDQDNDMAAKACCATKYHGAWWYSKCHDSNLNGLWGYTGYAKGLSWMTATGYYISASFTEMKIRPVQ